MGIVLHAVNSELEPLAAAVSLSPLGTIYKFDKIFSRFANMFACIQVLGSCTLFSPNTIESLSPR